MEIFTMEHRTEKIFYGNGLDKQKININIIARDENP